MKIVGRVLSRLTLVGLGAVALAAVACGSEVIGSEELAGADALGEVASELRAAPVTLTACSPQPQPVVVASASSQQAAKFSAEFAIDGSSSTRWSSNTNPDQTLLLDLGKLVNVSALNINWETAFSKAYRVEWSSDGQIWDPFIFAGATRPGVQRVSGFARTRYVRIHSTEPTNWRSVSIIDVQVIGTLDEGCPNLLAGAWALSEENVEPPTFDVSSLYRVTDNRIDFRYQGKPFTVVGAPPLGLHFTQPVEVVQGGRYRLRLDVTNVGGATTTMFHARLSGGPSATEQDTTPWLTIWTLSRPGGTGSSIIELEVSTPLGAAPQLELVSTPNTVYPGVGVQDFNVLATFTKVN
ncbi:MAG: discoidin domain-containing protein [Myxococcales bacterium]|nr:MAG: discoidin domain-containing protein [Myxococcales bacterium]